MGTQPVDMVHMGCKCVWGGGGGGGGRGEGGGGGGGRGGGKRIIYYVHVCGSTIDRDIQKFSF